MAKIVFLEGPFTGHELEIPDEGINIGRSQRCALTIPDGKISGEHAMLRQVDGSWWVYDLQSSNGTYVNGNPVQAVRIGSNDRIALGESVLTVDFGGEAAKPSEGGPTLKTGGTAGASQPETYVSRPHKKKPPENSAEAAAATRAEPNQDDLQTIKDLNAAYESMRTQIGRVIIGQS